MNNYAVTIAEAKSVYDAALDDHLVRVVNKLINTRTHTNIVDQYRTKKGSTALMFAALKGHNECLVTLLKCRAAVNIQDNNGITALMVAAMYGNRMCAKSLLEYKAAVNQPSDSCFTAIHFAAACNQVKCLEVLLNHNGAIPDIQDKWGHTPLEIAQEKHYDGIVKLLNDAIASNNKIRDKKQQKQAKKKDGSKGNKGDKA